MSRKSAHPITDDETSMHNSPPGIQPIRVTDIYSKRLSKNNHPITAYHPSHPPTTPVKGKVDKGSPCTMTGNCQRYFSSDPLPTVVISCHFINTCPLHQSSSSSVHFRHFRKRQVENLAGKAEDFRFHFVWGSSVASGRKQAEYFL